jgi:hypothetical protein
MDTTGAELIARYLHRRLRTRPGGVAVIAGAASLAPLQQARAASGLALAAPGAADVLAFDLDAGLRGADGLFAAARAAHRPLLGLAVQAPRRLIGSPACPLDATRRTLATLTRHTFHVGAAMELLELLPRAAALADARRAPVLLEIPQDVLGERVLGAWVPGLERALAPVPALAPRRPAAILA